MISEITEPITINLTMGNIAPSYLMPYTRNYLLPDDIFIWRDKLLSIDVTVSDIDTPNNIASEVMDRLFNAYGHEKNSHFNDAKELLPYK